MTSDKKIAVVGVAGGWSSESLADALAKRTGFRCLVDMAEASLNLADGSMKCNGEDLSRLDGMVIKKVGPRYSPDLLDRLEMLRCLNQRGLPIFSRPRAIMGTLDRLSCTVTLMVNDIPMPPTVVTESVDRALKAVEAMGPSVLKPLYSSKARGMRVVEPGDGLAEKLEAFKAEGNNVIYLQKMIDLPGKDLGVAFLGGKYLATYARARGKDSDSWNTTTHDGGHYEAHTPSEEIIELARRAQEPFGLDFTSVDVAETAQGPMVFEVSAFGGFRGLKVANQLDAAQLYADYVLEKVGR